VKKFANAIALVTGGASGIGGALCEELGERGATVIVTDINEAGAQQLTSRLTNQGVRAEAIRVDVTDSAAVEKVVHGAAAKHGRLDYIFNNAGIAAVGELRDSAPVDWHRVSEVNLCGVIYGTMAAYQIMLRQGAGHIVNVASLTGLMPTPVFALYSTTKWAVVGFSTALRAEAASLGVKVSVACPSLVDTNIPDRTAYFKVRKEEYLARLPRWLMMQPGHAAKSILRGVARNQAIIVCPFHARLAWWCYRLCPAVLSPVFQKTVTEFRKLRLSS
jgi:short-subunit dehydrogenase